MPAPYQLRAHNSARESENRIHDDAVARQFGFTGGLVPGVEVYAYMVHAPVAQWGRAWLERGTASCRFIKPVYEGDEISVCSAEQPDGLELKLFRVAEFCATGSAGLPDQAAGAEPFARPPEPPAIRLPANERTLAVGTLLSMRPLLVTPELAAQHRSDVRETDSIYEAENLVHPGLVLRTCNWALSQNVVLGPWMHVGSTVRHLRAARIGETLSVRARVSANYERKGHRFVELEALVTADGESAARVDHVAIYRPRQVSA